MAKHHKCGSSTARQHAQDEHAAAEAEQGTGDRCRLGTVVVVVILSQSCERPTLSGRRVDLNKVPQRRPREPPLMPSLVPSSSSGGWCILFSLSVKPGYALCSSERNARSPLKLALVTDTKASRPLSRAVSLYCSVGGSVGSVLHTTVCPC